MSNTPPVYMIAIEEHPVSIMYVREVLPSWKKFGVKINYSKATTPKDLAYRNNLTFTIKKMGREKREFTSTEKAVWYSHFDLWCKCVNEGPLIIVEHDSMLRKPLPNLSKEGYKFLSYVQPDEGEKYLLATGSGYYITPPVAERLIARAVCKPVDRNSDGHISSVLNFNKQRKMYDYLYIEQINFDGLNTIDHRTTKRNYIGLDYENIDLSSIHRQT
jgi:GR25 family glycosyltransferase involved in LPS biosynthesis